MSLALAFGCDDRDPDIMLMDSGMGGTDSGMMMGTDSGMMMTDSGSMARDCEMNLDPFPATLAPRCSADTKTCLEACTDGTCVNNCIAADTTPGAMAGSVTVTCGTCIGYNQEYCLEQNGSAAQIHALRCCITDNSCTTQACVNTNCSAQQAAVQSSPGAATCLVVPTMGPYAICFP